MSYSLRKQQEHRTAHTGSDQENGKLTVATEAAYEPFEYMDGDKIIGYNADLFAKICDDLGVELDYIDLPFQGILAGLEAKKYDVVGATLGVTAERAGKYTMTYPIQNGTTVFVKRKGDDSIKSIEDMSGKRSAHRLLATMRTIQRNSTRS